MLARDRKDIDRSARTAGQRGPKSVGRAGPGWSSAGGRKFQWPEFDQDRLTVVSLFIIVVLSALNFMLRFPELGAVIASFNQF